MGTVALIVFCVGALVSVVGGVWFLVVAFSESVLWGLGCMFIPFVGLIFLCMNFADAWRPFVLSLVGSVVMLGSTFMMPAP